MIFDMLAYFVWIVLTLGMVGLGMHLLRLDRPRPVRIPVERDERRYERR